MLIASAPTINASTPREIRALRNRPAWAPPVTTLAELRRRRTERRLLRSLRDGAWREVLLTQGHTQRQWKKVLREKVPGMVTAEPLFDHMNVFDLAVEMHAAIVAGRPPLLSAAVEDSQQGQFIERLRVDTLFNATFLEAVETAYAEGEQPMRVGFDDRGRMFLEACDNDECFPVGRNAPDGQPSVWERRWVIEHKKAGSNRKRELYLLIERHRVIEGRGAIETEAYEAESNDVLADARELKRVELASAFRDGVEREDLVEDTGSSHPLIVQVVIGMRRGRPTRSLSRHSLNLLDAFAGLLTSLDRMVTLHAHPRMRVDDVSGLVDEATGKVRLDDEIIQGVAEFLQAQPDIDGINMALKTVMQNVLAELRMSPALVGIRVQEGAAPETLGKLTLEATTTLSKGQKSATYLSAALSRLFTIASEVQSSLPGESWAVEPVAVEVIASLPKDQVQLSEWLTELKAGGLISEKTATLMLWGELRGPQILEQIEEEREAATRRERDAFMAALPPAERSGEGVPG